MVVMMTVKTTTMMMIMMVVVVVVVVVMMKMGMTTMTMINHSSGRLGTTINVQARKSFRSV